MRVAIDVSALSAGLRSGTAVYLYRLVEALGHVGDGTEFHLLYNGMPGVGEELATSLAQGRVRLTVARLRWPLLPGPLFPRPYPRKLVAAVHEADVFHVGEFVYPRPRAGQGVVATVHDVTTRLFPQWHNVWNRMLHRRRLAWIRAHATRVIIDAEATRQDTAAELAMQSDRLDVVPLARGTSAPLASVDAVRVVRSRFGLGKEPYMLFVGTLEPRKNLVRLVQAFAALPPELSQLRLVLGGAWGWHGSALRSALRVLGSRAVVTGPLDDATLPALYAGALAFAYPSLYEGFGLPVMEAMAAGVPVITSRGGTLEEVAGGAALLVDPTDVAEIAAALELLARDGAQRQTYQVLGRARERVFTWARTAERTVDVYRRAAREAAA